MTGEAADRGYVLCKCGWLYARALGDTEDTCQFLHCLTPASDMRPVSDAEAAAAAPRGATILVLTTRSFD